MVNLSKTNKFITIFFIVCIFLILILVFHRWPRQKETVVRLQEKEELKKQIEEPEEQKKNLQVYREEYIGYEIKYPEGWKVELKDRSTELPPTLIKDKFSIVIFSSPQKDARLTIDVNRERLWELKDWYYVECARKGKEVIINKNINIIPILAMPLKPGEEVPRVPENFLTQAQCEEMLFQQTYHTIFSDFCLDKNFKVIPTTLSSNCQKEKGNFYFKFIFECEGENYLGEEGLKKCEQLFDQIISTFRFIKK